MAKSKRKVALITGVTGQDGAYLVELLLKNDYIVHGVKRRSSSFNTGRIEQFYQSPQVIDPKFILHYGDMTDATNLVRLVKQTEPDEIYNLAAQSHVQVSFETPEYTGFDSANGRVVVEVDPRYFRPTEVDLLVGDPRKAERVLGWKHETTWQDLCAEMVAENIIRVGREDFHNADH